MSTSEERIKRNLEEISFPRLSGTNSEKKAAELIESKITDLKLPYEKQKFQFSTFYSRIYPKIAFSLTSWIFLVVYININAVFNFFAILIPIIIFIPFFILTRNPENIKIGQIWESQNIYVKISGKLKNSEVEEFNHSSSNEIKNVILSAHIDSKGQKIAARTRFLSIILWTTSLISLVILTIIRNFLLNLEVILNYIILIPLLINIAITIIFVVNITNNQSKGVVDNASGVVCVLEILNYFSENKDKVKNINLWFLFTGAEESGTMGIRYFQKKINHLDRSKTIIHNFESLGKSVAVFISKNNELNNPHYLDDFETKADKYNFRTYRSSISRGVHTDGIYMFQKGYNLFEFGSTEVGKYMHSETDSLANVDEKLLKKLCDFNIELLEKYI